MARSLSLFLGLLVVGPAIPTATAADALVHVELSSGREFTGILDARTNDQQLWLRWRVGEVELQRPIAWDRITAAQLQGEAIDVVDLKKRAEDLATPGRTVVERNSFRSDPEKSQLPATSVRPVRSIRCDAWLANWDADAEFDGLILNIETLDQDGIAVPATGTVEAELITIDYVLGYQASTSGGRIPVTLGRWSQPWESARRYVQLEFQARPPQLEPRLDRYAVLKVRVTIPGHGVFEQELDGIRTRPFTPVKNALWR